MLLSPGPAVSRRRGEGPLDGDGLNPSCGRMRGLHSGRNYAPSKHGLSREILDDAVRAAQNVDVKKKKAGYAVDVPN